MEPQVNIIDYLFAIIIMIAGFLSIRALIANVTFLRDEIKVPRVFTASQMPSKQRAFALMAVWVVLTAIFSGTAIVLFSKPARIISGKFTPDMYGWLAGLVMIVAAVACGLLVFRYYLFWTRFKR